MTRVEHPGPIMRPGRARRDEIDAAVIAATVELVLETTRPGDVTISAIVERSGSSRAAIYRRWRSREELVAAALDSVRAPVVVSDSGNLLGDLLSVYRPAADVDAAAFDRLLRRRLVLGLEDPGLQRAYWHAHVARRREPIAEALRRGVRRGLVRADADLDAAIDLLSGLAYYQLVVRGESLQGETAARVEEGIRLVWRSIAAA